VSDKKLRHLFIHTPPVAMPYTSTSSGGKEGVIPKRERIPHSQFLRSQFDQAWKESVNRQAVAHATKNGVYIEFQSDPGAVLVTRSLEDMRSKQVRLLNIRQEDTNKGRITYATVYMAHSKKSHFLKKLEKYATEVDNRSGKPKNRNLINSISDVRMAVLPSFWQDDKSDIPTDSPEWCEVWLSSDTDVVVNRFEELLLTKDIPSKPNSIRFPERSIKVVKVNRAQIDTLIENSDDIAELRKAKEVYFLLSLKNWDQSEWVRDLLNRVTVSKSNTSICILDNGVNNGHPLLVPVLDGSDMHTVDPQWGTHDHDKHGHGTCMAGVAAYGNLYQVLLSKSAVQIKHSLESVKVIPPPPDNNPKELWGSRIEQGVALAEIQAPKINRVICSAVTALDTRDRGRPSSWSGAIDQLASGSFDDRKRLIIQAAGNLSEKYPCADYPDSQKTDSIHDPAQAWNAVTVGAYTELTRIVEKSLQGFRPVAPAGGLSPFTTTSLVWEDKWPIKPEILMEGGNLACDPTGFSTTCNELSLISTCHDYTKSHFTSFNMTSAASAQAAWLAAKIQTKYPDLWPEMIRALLIHSAQWPQQLFTEYIGNGNKRDYKNLMRVCGYGVPDLEKALYSASNSLTMLIQRTIQPFAERIDKKTGSKTGYKTNEMHCFDLPWPKEVLQQMNDIKVSMRVTLSYFIEPGPGEIGWKDRYRYASYGLRFDVKSPNETIENFTKRINVAMRDEDTQAISKSQSAASHWVIGPKIRDKGSIHSDIWNGTAADLAESNVIAVYPCIGWWKERSHLDKWHKEARYALIVSINTPEQSVDLYTPVLNKIKVPVMINTSIS
jgi:hypothetical protein